MLTADSLYGPIPQNGPPPAPSPTSPATATPAASGASAATGGRPGPARAAGADRSAIMLLVVLAGVAIVLTQLTVRGELEVSAG